MNILLVTENNTVVARLSTLFDSMGYEVANATNLQSSLLAVNQKAPKLVLLHISSGIDRYLSIIEELRRRINQFFVVQILHDGTLTEKFLASAYGKGADGEISLKRGDDYLRERFSAVDRLCELADGASSTGKKSGLAAPHKPKTRDISPIQQVINTHAWVDAREHLRDATAQFLVLDTFVDEITEGSDTHISYASALVLSNVQQQLEVRLAIGGDESSISSLATHMFGPDGESLKADMLGEINNIFMGTMKTAFHEEGVPFVGGLPEVITLDQLLRPSVMYTSQDTFLLKAASATVFVHIGMRSKANVALPVSQLKEGMVLARDVFSMRGLKLIGGGTRLSENMISKLKSTLPAQQTIEIMAQ